MGGNFCYRESIRTAVRYMRSLVMGQVLCGGIDVSAGQTWSALNGGPSCTVVRIEVLGEHQYVLYRLEGETHDLLLHRRPLADFQKQYQLESA